MVGKLQPLVDNQAIVRPDFTPTEYFIRWAQQRQIDIGQAVSEERALEIVTAFVTQFIIDNPLIAGSGINLSPSGILSDGVTISAITQDILDQISTAHGTVLFRGASDWQALAPGTAGDFLQTTGPGADPVWAAAGGGGGGVGWTEVGLWSHAVSGNTPFPFNFTGLGTFTELMVQFNQCTVSASSLIFIRLSVDNGATYFSGTGNYKSFIANNASDQNIMRLFTTSGTTGLTKSTIITNCDLQPAYMLNPGGEGFMFTASNLPINAIQLGSLLGAPPSLTGGTLRILTR